MSAANETSDRARLTRLLRGSPRCISIVTYEEDYALGLLRDIALESARPMAIWCACNGLRDGLLGDSVGPSETEKALTALQRLGRSAPRTVFVMLDLLGHLRDERVLRALRAAIPIMERVGSHIVLLDHRDEVPSVIAVHSASFEVSLPGENELEALTIETLRRINRERAIDVNITRRQLATLVSNLRGLSRRQAEQIIAETVVDDARFDESDLRTVMLMKRNALRHAGLLEFVDTPVALDQIGGLKRLKHWLSLRQNAFSTAASEFGLAAPRGILLLGVQGAGKSMCAKAIATGWGRPLLRMDVGALYDRYVGESERRLRDALRQAETMAPVILWIDEIEKAFASAASRSTDGGLSQRMFGMLLTWMQEHKAPVFLVATANDIEALPPELLRKGRFDEIFFVDLPSPETRRQILEIHLKRRMYDVAQFDLTALTDASAGYSGAEIEHALVAALHDAYGAGKPLSTEGIVQALAGSPPLSVTMSERIAALRAWAAGRCVPAD